MKPYWTDAHGQLWLAKDMSTPHLENLISFLEVNGIKNPFEPHAREELKRRREPVVNTTPTTTLEAVTALAESDRPTFEPIYIAVDSNSRAITVNIYPNGNMYAVSLRGSGTMAKYIQLSQDFGLTKKAALKLAAALIDAVKHAEGRTR